jgi:four helix bundle protein
VKQWAVGSGQKDKWEWTTMTVRNYRDLIAWQKAMDLVVLVYEATCCFPTDERYGLTAQIRRAAVSIPSNIAEGQGRQGTGEFLHFLSIAHGSLREVETQALIARRLGYLDDGDTNRIMNAAGEVGRLVNGLMNSLR